MVIGGALARYMLWKRFSVPPDAQICYGKFGKPYLPFYPHVHFNISHSGQYVVCAVCDISIGVDIHQIVPYCPDIATRILSPNEIRQIESSSNQSAEFTRIWTQIEAQAKATGTGMVGKLVCNISPAYKTSSYSIGNAFISFSYKL